MLNERINKVLNWGIKLASLAVTGPATWAVATGLFEDIQSPTLLFVIRFSAVFLIEGVMLSNWLLLEFDKKATPEIKARYGLTALAMYIALLVIAWRHEGPTGLVFRFALLTALLGSGWDTYVYTWRKALAKADRDISHAAAVRRYQRRLSILDAKETLAVDYELLGAQRQVDKQVHLEEIEVDKVERLTLLKESHKQTLSGLGREQTHSDNSQRKTRKTSPSHQLSKQEALEHMLDIYRSNPNASLREVGDRIGRSHQTVSVYLDRLEAEDKVRRNGAGIEVLT